MLSGREQNKQRHDGKTPSLHVRCSFLHDATDARGLSTFAATSAISRLSSPGISAHVKENFANGRPGSGTGDPVSHSRSEPSRRVNAVDPGSWLLLWPAFGPAWMAGSLL